MRVIVHLRIFVHERLLNGSATMRNMGFGLISAIFYYFLVLVMVVVNYVMHLLVKLVTYPHLSGVDDVTVLVTVRV